MKAFSFTFLCRIDLSQASTLRVDRSLPNPYDVLSKPASNVIIPIEKSTNHAPNIAKSKAIEVWKDTGINNEENSDQKEKQEERQSSWCSLYLIGRIFGLILLLISLVLIVMYATGSFDAKMPSKVVLYSQSTTSSTPKFQKMYPKHTNISVIRYTCIIAKIQLRVAISYFERTV